jgi:hypothetical protein
MKKPLAVRLEKAPPQFENCADDFARGNKKGRHPPGGAPTNRIL